MRIKYKSLHFICSSNVNGTQNIPEVHRNKMLTSWTAYRCLFPYIYLTLKLKENINTSKLYFFMNCNHRLATERRVLQNSAKAFYKN